MEELPSYWIQGASLTVPSLLRGAFIPSLSPKVTNGKRNFSLALIDESEGEWIHLDRKFQKKF